MVVEIFVQRPSTYLEPLHYHRTCPRDEREHEVADEDDAAADQHCNSFSDALPDTFFNIFQGC